MKNWSIFQKVLKSKYLLALILFVVWIVFFDRNDLITQWERRSELKKLETSQAYYEKEIKATQKELADLDSDTKVLEKFAREKFYLKRPNEDVFIVVDSRSIKN